MREHLKQIAMQPINARANFVEMLVESFSITKDEAEKVFDVYHKERVLKFDRYHSRYTVKHGGFLDADVIQRAINF